MGVYHKMLAHFPMALWMTTALVILIRALFDSAFARTCDKALPPLLLLGVLSGALTYAVGLLVWPLEAVTNSPMARNHMLWGAWTLAYWTALWVTRWHAGEHVWEGARRWIMLGLGLLGAGLLSITGTLGGYLSGSPSAVSDVVRWLGWEVYTTFYVPNFMLVLLVIAAVVLAVMGVVGKQQSQT